MFSLIIAIVSIALIVALVAMSGYFGGDAVSDAQAKTQAARLINEETQILGAMDMYQADKKAWPTNLEELITGGYLRSIPTGVSMQTAQASSYTFEFISSARAADGAPALGWSMPAARTPIIYTVKVPKTTCQAYNLASRGDNGILRLAFETLPAQCYGAEGDYRVVVKKAVANVTLSGILDSSVEQGDLPSKNMDDWWDSAPSNEVKVPTDPDKTPKAELALGGAVPVAFGQVQLRQVATSGGLTVSNRGKVAADGLAIQVPTGFDLVNSTCGAQLGAGATCSFSLNFTPVQAQAFSGALKVTATNGPSVQSTVSGEGVAGGATLSGVAFGDVPAGQQVLQDAVLRNTGLATLRLGAPGIVGTGFSISSNGCGASLAAGTSCNITVALAAVSTNAYAGQLSVATAEAGLQQVSLSGQSRLASLTSADVAFGEVPVNTTVSSSLVLTNNGNLPITAPTIGTPTGAGYALGTNGCTGVLAAGSNCSVALTFRPTSAVAFPSAIQVGYKNSMTSASSNVTVNLTGAGGAPRATLSAVDFGTQIAGTKTELLSTFTNTGVVPIAFSNVTVSTTVGAGFSFTALTCSGTIAPGGTCTITVRFTAPASTSTNKGEVTFISAAGLQVKAALTGNSGAGLVSYTLGTGGGAGNGSNNGANGTATTASYNGMTLVAGGGGGGYYNSTVPAVGGTGSGGTTSVTGGAGGIGSNTLSYGGGGGGAIGGGAGANGNGSKGGDGGVVVAVQGLPTVLANAGYDTSSRALGASNSSTNNDNGGNTYAIGFGGGGASPFGGTGGQGGPGAGGGGAAGYSIIRNGGMGGGGYLVLYFTDGSAAVLASGTSYSVPVTKVLSKMWAIGAGGGGAGAPAIDTMSGGGGGAGAVVYAAF